MMQLGAAFVALLRTTNKEGGHLPHKTRIRTNKHRYSMRDSQKHHRTPKVTITKVKNKVLMTSHIGS